MTVFDNANGGGADNEPTARGLILSVDWVAMTVTLVQQFIPSFNKTAQSQGSVEVSVPALAVLED